MIFELGNDPEPPPRLRAISAAKSPPEANLLARVVVRLIKPHEHEQRERCLHWAVNNAHFLIFPDRQGLPSLASRDFHPEHGKPKQLVLRAI